MKLKTYMAMAGTAALVLAGGLTVHADSVTLAGGEKLNLGTQVGVYDGERSFFGARIHDWLAEDDAAQDLARAMGQTGLVKDEAQRKELAALAVDVFRNGKVYQVRSNVNDTYYQGLLVSLSVSDMDLLKLALMANPGPALPADSAAKGETPRLVSVKERMEKERTAAAEKEQAGGEKQEKVDPVKSVQSLIKGTLQVTDHTDWTDGTSKDGISYRTGSAQLSLTRGGFAIPLYVKGIITRGEGRGTYTILVADQVSGSYFQPVFDKALKGAKK